MTEDPDTVHASPRPGWARSPVLFWGRPRGAYRSEVSYATRRRMRRVAWRQRDREVRALGYLDLGGEG